jgi:hypothetical protein
VARAITRGILAGWFQIAVSVVLGPLYTLLVLSFLPRDEAGYWMVLVSLIAYVNLFDVGLGPTVTRLTAFARGHESKPSVDPGDVYWTSQRLYLGLVALVLAIGAVVGVLILPRVTSLEWTGARKAAWCLFVVGSAAGIYAAHPFAVASGSGMVSIQRLGRAMAHLVGVGLAAAAGFAGFGLVGFAAAWATQNALLLFAVPLVRQLIPDVKSSRAFHRALARQMIGPSLRWAGTNLGGALILATAPLIVATRVSVASVPNFVVARQLAETLYVLALMPAQVIEPFISSRFAAGDLAAVTAMLRSTLRRVTTLLAVGVTAGCVFGREIISAWVGPENFVGYVSLWLLLVLYALEAHHVVHAIAVMATGRIVFLRVAILSGLVTVGLGVSLAGGWGIPGVVAGMVIAQLATNNWYVPLYSLRLFRVSIGEYGRWVAPSFAAAALTGAIAVGLRWFLLRTGSSSPSALALTLLTLAIMVIPIVWVVGLTATERVGAVTTLRRALGA